MDKVKQKQKYLIQRQWSERERERVKSKIITKSTTIIMQHIEHIVNKQKLEKKGKKNNNKIFQQ